MKTPPHSDRYDAETEWPASSVGRAHQTTLLRVSSAAGASILGAFEPFVSQYVADRFMRRLAERVCVASYELFANGLAYGSLTREVVYELSQHGTQLEICVTNGAIPSRISMLEAHLRTVKSDPEAVYVEEMRRSVASGGRPARLGLARVFREAGMKVRLEADRDSVSVFADCSI